MLTKQEIRQLDPKSLQQEIASAQNDLLKIRFKLKSGNSKEIHMTKKLKKYIAQMKTIEKEFSGEKSSNSEVQNPPVAKAKKTRKAQKTVNKE